MLLHAFTTIVSSVVVALAVTFGQAPAAGPEDLNKLTPEQLKAGLEKQHPAAYYVLAGKLFGTGQKDEAVFGPPTSSPRRRRTPPR